ncbi:MAG: spore germination protein GerW family protein [Thermomicrobiales bacterium]
MTPSDAVERHRDEIESAGQLIDRIIDGTIGRVLGHAEASTIFGEATTQGECTIVPVGRVSSRYGFGGGAGEGTSGESDGDSGGGGGGGGGGQLDVKPIGYIEITSNGSRFVDITDTSAVAIRAVTMGGVVAILFVLGLFRTIRSRK